MMNQALPTQVDPQLGTQLAVPLSPVSLGPFRLDHPFILAPMAGITHSPFRRLMRRMQSALVVSELISANGLEFSGKRTLDLLRFHEEERIIGLQIFGEREDLLCKACQQVEKLGADFVDLNLGCPVPKIVKRGAGSAMCRDPITLGKTLKALVKSVHIPVTIKIRTGWDAGSKNAIEVVKVAADAGIQWVAIHGRTRSQGYSGSADWDLIGTVKAKSSIPIIGNGDITTPELAVERVHTYGVDAVMIGRGVLRNPFLFEQSYALWKEESYKQPLLVSYLRLIQEHQLMLEEIFPSHIAMLYARKFIAWFSTGFRGCHEFRKKIFSIPQPEVFWEETHRFFERTSSKRDFEFLSQPFLMGGHG